MKTATKIAITGLTLAHGRGHVFRALLESVAYGTRLNHQQGCSHVIGGQPTCIRAGLGTCCAAAPSLTGGVADKGVSSSLWAAVVCFAGGVYGIVLCVFAAGSCRVAASQL